jgi:16S rRNA (guanine966-N2)-methyltransferase
LSDKQKMRALTAQGAARGKQSRVLRIIGGRWRGRRLRFPPLPDIRPTPDRVRETLFNWLGARVQGARCLDLFAGSGALGLEALSRGAALVAFVEREPVAVRELRARLAEWGEEGAEVIAADALQYLAGAARAGGAATGASASGVPEPFSIVFLDPPFTSGLLTDSAQRLESGGWLDRNALIYVETDRHQSLPGLPANWQLSRAKQAGTVGYHLLRRSGSRGEGE